MKILWRPLNGCRNHLLPKSYQNNTVKSPPQSKTTAQNNRTFHTTAPNLSIDIAFWLQQGSLPTPNFRVRSRTAMHRGTSRTSTRFRRTPFCFRPDAVRGASNEGVLQLVIPVYKPKLANGGDTCRGVDLNAKKGLSYVHNLGLVHSDFKLQNILSERVEEKKDNKRYNFVCTTIDVAP